MTTPAADATTVVVVDDTAVLRLALRGYLDGEGGWEVVGEAVDARSALALAAAGCPGVIVLDQQLPDQDGVDALPALRAQCPHARIVMWSNDPDVEQLAFRRGADAFVDKALPLADLVDAMQGPPRDG